LAGKSKDILVASYFAVSQIHQNQLDGLGVGITVYHDIIETYWEDLYPKKKRMKGRINAIEWWIGRTETALAQVKPVSMSSETKDGILENLEKIQTMLDNKLPEAPLVRPILRALDNFKAVSKEEPVPEAPPPQEKIPEPVTSAPAAAPVASPQPEAVEMASEADAQKIAASGFKIIGRAASYLINNHSVSPLGYRYARMSVWSSIEDLPMAADGNKTIIPPPDLQFVNILKDLKAKGNFKNLLEAAESKVVELIFWLDLNRYAAEALTGLGDQYEKAKDAVCMETAFFLNRLSGLDGLAFADGTPFADNETKEWIREIGFSDVTEMAAPVTPISPSGEDGQGKNVLAEEIANAHMLAKTKKLKEAVELLSDNLKKSVSDKEKLLWRIGLSQVLIGSKKADMTLPHLEHILSDIEDYKLEKWDPDIALNGYKTVLAALKTQKDDDAKSKAKDILGKIAKLDAVEAFKIG
jgi:type VI secretion system protein VasJ